VARRFRVRKAVPHSAWGIALRIDGTRWWDFRLEVFGEVYEITFNAMRLKKRQMQKVAGARCDLVLRWHPPCIPPGASGSQRKTEVENELHKKY